MVIVTQVGVYLPVPSRLYRSLEDYDVVRGIFGGKVGTKSVTCAALQAEAGGDYAEAVKLYNEVKLWLYLTSCCFSTAG